MSAVTGALVIAGMSRRNPEEEEGFDGKDTERFDKTASEVGGALGNPESVPAAQSEIRADEEGIFDFDSRLGFLYKEGHARGTRQAE